MNANEARFQLDAQRTENEGWRPRAELGFLVGGREHLSDQLSEERCKLNHTAALHGRRVPAALRVSTISSFQLTWLIWDHKVCL